MWIVPFTPCTSSPEPVEESSRTSSRASVPSAPSKSSRIHSVSSAHASPASPSGTTSAPSAPTTPNAPTPSLGSGSIEPTSLSREASRAKTFLARARAVGSRAGKEAASGASSREYSARFDPASRSWRTAPSLLGADWESFSGTWPRSGMMLAGRCWPLETSARDTFASESGLPLLCGTATSNCCARGGAFVSATPTAVELMHTREMFPTPVAGAGNFNAAGASSKSGDGLWTALQKRAGITPPRVSRLHPAATTGTGATTRTDSGNATSPTSLFNIRRPAHTTDFPGGATLK